MGKLFTTQQDRPDPGKVKFVRDFVASVAHRGEMDHAAIASSRGTEADAIFLFHLARATAIFVKIMFHFRCGTGRQSGKDRKRYGAVRCGYRLAPRREPSPPFFPLPQHDGVQHAITMPPLPSSNERRDHHVGETEQERRAPRDAEKGVQNDPV